jgi:hypothetical protein
LSDNIQDLMAQEKAVPTNWEDEMSKPLATYLRDHLAGATHAVGLVESLRDDYSDKPIGQFAGNLLAEIKSDRAILQKIAETSGSGESHFKDAVARLSDKISRIKLNHTAGIGLLESLEFLELGILGKCALWRSLAAIAPSDSRLSGIHFDDLLARAETQSAQVEDRRLEAALSALRAPAL